MTACRPVGSSEAARRSPSCLPSPLRPPPSLQGLASGYTPSRRSYPSSAARPTCRSTRPDGQPTSRTSRWVRSSQPKCSLGSPPTRSCRPRTFADLTTAARLHRDLRPTASRFQPSPRGRSHEVPLRRAVVEKHQGLVLGDDERIDPPVVVEVARSQAAAGAVPGTATRPARDVGQPAPLAADEELSRARTPSRS